MRGGVKGRLELFRKFICFGDATRPYGKIPNIYGFLHSLRLHSVSNGNFIMIYIDFGYILKEICPYQEHQGWNMVDS